MDKGRHRVYTLGDDFGPFLEQEFRKLPHALRAARERARGWSRTIRVSDGRAAWFVRPDGTITRAAGPG